MTNIIRVKFLYRAAVAELDAGHPFSAGMAVSLLQDAVEAMAYEAAASVGADVGPRSPFLDYWDKISRAPGGKALPFRLEMSALNAARVAFKHHGSSPALSDAEKHLAAAHRFLVETATSFFTVDFDGMSEADLIAASGIRDALRLAEQALADDDAIKALEHCRDALDGVETLMRSAIVVADTDPFAPKIPREWAAAVGSYVEWVSRRFASLEKSVTLSTLQVNPADYWFLNQSLPMRVASEKFYWPPSRSIISTRTIERARTCIRIIINLALRAERVHSDFQRLAIQAGVPQEQKRIKELLDKHLNQQVGNQSESVQENRSPDDGGSSG